MIFSRLFFEWSILLAILAFGLYTMRVIKNEKTTFLKEAKIIEFKIFKFMIPKWWGVVETNQENELCFQRLDTRYEWVAKFTWSDTPASKNIIELFTEHINARQILFDEESSIIYNPKDFEELPFIKNGEFEMVRIEGTATYDRSERLYYDAFLIRRLSDNHFLYAESRSSILNGLVEGPYFEEVMTQLQLI